LTAAKKTAGLSNLSNKRAFHQALSLLFGKEPSVVIPQDLRISKLHSTATMGQNIVFNRSGAAATAPAAPAAALPLL
jgi:hypothetical protein